MAVQKHHDLAEGLLLRPGGQNARSAHRTDAVDLGLPVRCAQQRERLRRVGVLMNLAADDSQGQAEPVRPSAAGSPIPSASIEESVRRCVIAFLL
jgi:hypothetical protein